MRSRRILAVDCGASHVACGLFSRAATGRLVVERFATTALPGQDLGEDEWVAAVVASLKELGRRERLRGACVLGVPGYLTFAKLIRVPDVSMKQRRKIIRFEARQSLSATRNDVVWTATPVAGNGSGSDVTLTAVRRRLLTALGTRLRAAGFRPWAVLPAWFALRHGAGRPGLEAAPALVLGIGARSTHLVYSGAARFFLRAMALGGNAVTQRVAEELQTDNGRAEALKCQVFGGAAEPAPDTPERTAVVIAADEFVRRVGGEVSRSLASLFPEGGDRRPAVLHLTGGGSLMPGLPRALAERLEMRVEAGEVQRDVGVGVAVAGRLSRLDGVALADLSGLAAGAMNREAAAANLLPQSWRWEMRIHRWWPALAAAVVLVTLGLFAAVSEARAKANALRERSAALEARIEVLHRLDRRNHDNLARLTATNQRIAALQKLVAMRSAWIAVLADLQACLVKAEDAWLESLRILPPAPSGATDPTAAGNAGSGNGPRGGDGGSDEPAPPVRLALAGCLFDASSPRARPGEASGLQAKFLLTQFRALPWVVGIEAERFDNSQPGLLRFELTLVLAPGTLF